MCDCGTLGLVRRIGLFTVDQERYDECLNAGASERGRLIVEHDGRLLGLLADTVILASSGRRSRPGTGSSA